MGFEVTYILPVCMLENNCRQHKTLGGQRQTQRSTSGTARTRVTIQKRRKTNEEHSAETRATLLRVARREFAQLGFAETGTERIVQLAGVTRGALYHHYAGKKELFDAVVSELAREICERIERAARASGGPFEALVVGCDAWLDACLDRDVQRIMLLDGPAVLGWRRWSEIDAQYGTGSLRQGIDACIVAGALVPVDAHTLTRLLAGAMNDVALMLAQAGDAKARRRKVGQTLHALLQGLRSSRAEP